MLFADNPMTSTGVLLNNQTSPPVSAVVGQPDSPGGNQGIMEAGSLQNQLYSIEHHYRLQAQLLNQQFEEKRRQLEQEQQAKMEEYIKVWNSEW